VDLVVDGATGAIKDRKDFKDRHLIDRIVGTGIAAHEGQLFGWTNQRLLGSSRSILCRHLLAESSPAGI
jgi:uncharacterized iron-regulated membrane protein